MVSSTYRADQIDHTWPHTTSRTRPISCSMASKVSSKSSGVIQFQPLPLDSKRVLLHSSPRFCFNPCGCLKKANASILIFLAPSLVAVVYLHIGTKPNKGRFFSRSIVTEQVSNGKEQEPKGFQLQTNFFYKGTSFRKSFAPTEGHRFNQIDFSACIHSVNCSPRSHNESKLPNHLCGQHGHLIIYP